MNDSQTYPQVGIGVLIERADGRILVGKRKGSHAPYYSIPGGKLELGERFEEAARKEVAEETGLKIFDPKVFCVTNNLNTYQEYGLHFVSINLHVQHFEGSPKVLEPSKCEGWLWCDPRELPQPHFEASTLAVTSFLKHKFYLETQNSDH